MSSRGIRYAIFYLVALQVLFLFAELATFRIIDEGFTYLLRPALVLLTFPSSSLGGYVEWYAPVLFGYEHGDLKAFWPRVVTWQLPIWLNFAGLLLLVKTGSEPGTPGRKQ